MYEFESAYFFHSYNHEKWMSHKLDIEGEFKSKDENPKKKCQPQHRINTHEKKMK